MDLTVSNSPPLIIGLTGGIGCGKSLIAAELVKRGAFLVDTDQIAHQLTTPHGSAIPAIAEAFGQHFISANGALDRAAMRQAVFSNPTAKQQLEGILHPLIRQQVVSACSHAPADASYIVVDIPLLIETGREHYPCQRILVVDCPEDLQIARVMARNGFSMDQVKAIMSQQCTRSERLAAADDIIDNTGSVKALTEQLNALHDRYQAIAASAK